LIVQRNHRTIKKSGQTTIESHDYLSSVPPEHYRPLQWLQLTRDHWAGVEIRNHWRRDALMGEDTSRSRNPRLLANLALLRSARLALICSPVGMTSPVSDFGSARAKFTQHSERDLTGLPGKLRSTAGLRSGR
jgi:hypothetical protein